MLTGETGREMNNDTADGIREVFAGAARRADDAASNIEYELTRPSVLFRPKLSVEGNQWLALYGDNIQDGVSGFGASPEAAMRNFDKEWHATLGGAK